MVFSKKQTIAENMTLADLSIIKVSKCRFLGFLLNDTINWQDHIDHACKKLNIALSILLKCSSFLPATQLMLIFNAIGLSHITYGCQLYENAPAYQISKVRTKYNECLRVVYGFKKSRYKRTKEILETLNMLPLEELVIKHTCMLILKCIQGKGPKYLINYFNIPNARTLNLHVPRVCSNLGKRAFSYRAPFIIIIIIIIIDVY